ncbi:hypothetical protein IMG5_160570, partial [Ichthyophthirius multifiliis]
MDSLDYILFVFIAIIIWQLYDYYFPKQQKKVISENSETQDKVFLIKNNIKQLYKEEKEILKVFLLIEIQLNMTEYKILKYILVQKVQFSMLQNQRTLQEVEDMKYLRDKNAQLILQKWWLTQNIFTLIFIKNQLQMKNNNQMLLIQLFVQIIKLLAIQKAFKKNFKAKNKIEKVKIYAFIQICTRQQKLNLY